MRKAGGLLLVLASVSTARAGGWTQPEGGAYVKVWNRVLAGDRAFLADGGTADLDAGFFDWSLNAYAEYGLVDGTTLVVAVTPVGLARLDVPGAEVATGRDMLYAGPLRAGVRQRLLAGRVAHLAFEGRYGYAPPDESDVVEGVTEDGERWFYQPAVEAHTVDAELQLGLALPAGFWIALHGGARAAVSDEVPHAATAYGQVGVSLPWGFVLDAHVSVLQPFDDVEESNVSGAGATRYIGPGVGLSWWFLEGWALNFGVDSAVQAEAAQAAAPYTFGIEARR